MQLKGETPKTPEGDAPNTPQEVKTPKSVKKLNGMQVEDVKEGTGPAVQVFIRDNYFLSF